MGFLRVKTVKGHQYIYWCQRVRSRKKSGGDGKIKCPDFLIGTSIIQGKYLAFYFHIEEVRLHEYAAAAIDYICKTQSCRLLGVKHRITDISTVHIDWRAQPKVYLRSTHKLIDFRRRHWQKLKQILQANLDSLWRSAQQAQEDIDEASYYLAKYQEWTKEGESQRNELQNYCKNPSKEWTTWESVQDEGTGVWEQREFIHQWKENADIILDEEITRLNRIACEAWDKYEETLTKIITYAPRQRQEEFKRVTSGQIERLAQNTCWLERYEAKL